MNDLLNNEFNPNKIWAQFDKLLKLSRNEKVCPTTLELDVCGACNHHCRWCVDPSHNQAMLSVADAKSVLDDATAIGIRGVVFKGGGEPSLNPAFADILRYAKEKGFEVGVVTNGTRLRQLSGAYLDSLDYLRVSCDGATPEARLASHGVDDFFELKSAVRALTERRTKRQPVVGLTFCMEYAQIGDIPQMIAFGEEVGADYVLPRPVFGEEVGYTPAHTAEEADCLRREIAKQAANYSGKVMVMAGDWKGDSEFSSDGEDGESGVSALPMTRRDTVVTLTRFNGIEHTTCRCPAAGLLMVVTAELDVYFCCCTRGLDEFKMGSLRYGNCGVTLLQFWQSNAFHTQLSRLQRCECLHYCTHPMEKYNRVIEYLSLKDKHHTNFI